MLLERLTNAIGVSGREDEVREILRAEVGRFTATRTDALGNLIAYKDGSGPKVLLAAHMDEVGLMITGIEKSGLLKFRPVGGIDPRVLVAKTVLVGKDKVHGVIGSKPIHLQKPDERKKPIRLEEMYIDIGAKDDNEAKSKVHIGDYAGFATKYEPIGRGCAKAKAFDDRVGCSIVAELLQENFDLRLYGAFTVQEEVGLRGAGVAAYDIQPDLALVLEGTTASDVAGIPPHLHATTMGAGPALTFMDRSAIPTLPILRRLMELAEKHGIPVQKRRTTTGGTDAGKIQLSRTGVPVAVIAVPCRYIHSPVSVISLQDRERAISLVRRFLESIQQGGINV